MKLNTCYNLYELNISHNYVTSIKYNAIIIYRLYDLVVKIDPIIRKEKKKTHGQSLIIPCGKEINIYIYIYRFRRLGSEQFD